MCSVFATFMVQFAVHMDHSIGYMCMQVLQLASQSFHVDLSPNLSMTNITCICSCAHELAHKLNNVHD